MKAGLTIEGGTSEGSMNFCKITSRGPKETGREVGECPAEGQELKWTEHHVLRWPWCFAGLLSPRIGRSLSGMGSGVGEGSGNVS